MQSGPVVVAMLVISLEYSGINLRPLMVKQLESNLPESNHS